MLYVLSLFVGMGFLIVSATSPLAQQLGDVGTSYQSSPSARKVGPVTAGKNKSAQMEKSLRSKKAGAGRESAQRKSRPAASRDSSTDNLSANIQTGGLTAPSSIVPRTPPPKEGSQIQTRLEPGDSVKAEGPSSEGLSSKFNHVEIWVSHSQHELKLLGASADGNKEVLYEAKVGLGAHEFPTPVGVYYVTHIYDDNPWWIPPKDRAWAAGERPSKRVYGGTMAPLLKKRAVKSKNQPPQSYDLVDGQVRVDDYGYRFHGTNAPRSIGHNQSHGCVRMRPEDAAKVAFLIKEHVGMADRKGTENGTYVVLRSPVRLNLVK